MQGGKDHTSHRLVSLGLTQRESVVILYVLSAALGFTAITLSRAAVETGKTTGAALALTALSAFVFLELTYIRNKREP